MPSLRCARRTAGSINIEYGAMGMVSGFLAHFNGNEKPGAHAVGLLCRQSVMPMYSSAMKFVRRHDTVDATEAAIKLKGSLIAFAGE